MHRLVSRYPEDELSDEGRRLRAEYLEAAAVMAPPKTVTVTRWNADYDESDPRIQTMDPKGTVLKHQPGMEMVVYPGCFRDGSYMSDENGRIYDQANELFAILERFVAAACPSDGAP
jgi:hypothetical protein